MMCESTLRCPLTAVFRMGISGRKSTYRNVCARHTPVLLKALFRQGGRVSIEVTQNVKGVL